MKYQLHTCVWETTLRCNFQCRHCGSGAGKARGEELTLLEVKKMISELSSLGCERIIFAGGEPFLRRDILEVSQEARRRDMRVSVISNGFLVPEKTGLIEKMDLYSLGLSLDGLEGTHNYLRNNARSFARIMESIEAVRNKKLFLDLYLVTQVNKLTFPEIEKLYNLIACLEVSGWQLQLTNDMGRAEDLKNIMLDREQIREVLDFILEKKNGALKVYSADDLGYYYRGEFEFGGCSAGIHTIGIKANGDVLPCLSMQKSDIYLGGNLRERSLASIWHDPKFAVDNRQPKKLEGQCALCKFRKQCRGGCLGTAMAFDSPGSYPFCARAR